MAINLSNIDDVFDVVVDATLASRILARDLIEDICFSLYRDKRGGALVDLYSSDEFLTALDWQYGMVTR